MARMIEAFVVYGPKLVRRPTVRLPELTKRMVMATGLRSGEVKRVLDEVADAILDYGQKGAGLELPGIGTFRPSLRGDGELRINFRPHSELISVFDNLKAYRGEIVNRENVGLTADEYKALWDAEHPEDPLDLTAGQVEAA